eukprot:COSAG01_NODE_27875_length_674_cov_2.417391_1_plen_44_part_10
MCQTEGSNWRGGTARGGGGGGGPPLPEVMLVAEPVSQEYPTSCG